MPAARQARFRAASTVALIATIGIRLACAPGLLRPSRALLRLANGARQCKAVHAGQIEIGQQQ